jgi:hypothetical protein
VRHSGPHRRYTVYIKELLTDEYNRLPAGFTPQDANAALDRVIDQGKEYVTMVGVNFPGIRLS